MMRPFLFLALSACHPAGSQSVEAREAVSIDPHEHVVTDVRGTVASIHDVRVRVLALSLKQRAEARDAAAVLMVNCPYNRASFQLPLALERIAAKYDVDGQPDLIREDWRRLRSGLAAHVEVLDALGEGELPRPRKGDYLTALAPELVLDRQELMRSDDPVGVTMELMLQIQELVDNYDADTKSKIDAASATLSSATGNQWTLKLQLIGWMNALERIQPFVQDKAMSEDVQKMIAGVRFYLGQFC